MRDPIANPEGIESIPCKSYTLISHTPYKLSSHHGNTIPSRGIDPKRKKKISSQSPLYLLILLLNLSNIQIGQCPHLIHWTLSTFLSLWTAPSYRKYHLHLQMMCSAGALLPCFFILLSATQITFLTNNPHVSFFSPSAICLHPDNLSKYIVICYDSSAVASYCLSLHLPWCTHKLYI